MNNNMENYPSYSYPDSGDSSPRSRETDFENPPPSWEEQPTPPTLPATHKVKFMVSYGGKIQPRSHDNLLSYVGGETKILAVDRGVKFSTFLARLSSLVDTNTSTSNNSISSSVNEVGFTFKYQLPGEDLDALISVTNNDDLEHMMHEYDRMYRGSSKPARLRLFVFNVNHQGSTYSSTSSDHGNPKLDSRGQDRIDRFVDALNSGPGDRLRDEPPSPISVSVPVPVPAPIVNGGNMDFLFGLDKGPVPVQVPVQAPVHVMKSHEPVPEPDVRELNRLQISAQEHQQRHQQQQHQQAETYRPKSEEGNLVGNFAGDMYQKPAPVPATIPANMQIPAGYWQQVEQHQQQMQPPPQQPPQFHHLHPQQQPPQQQHQMYMMHAPPQASVFHAPMVRPGQPGQGYYQVQRMPQQTEQVYREQPVYTMPVPASVVGAKAGGYSEGMGVPARPVGVENGGYAQVAYDSATGRQVYYAAPQPQQGGVPFQGVGGDGKVVQKGVPTSAAVRVDQ